MSGPKPGEDLGTRDSAGIISTGTPASSIRRWPIYAGIVAILLIVFAANFYRRQQPGAFGPLSVVPVTSDPGSERDPAISPDGKYVAYSSVAPDLHTRLHIRPIDGGAARTITSAPENEWSPAWSPDGSTIAFLRGDPAGNAALFLIPALGGDERKLADLRPHARRRTQFVGHLIAWTPDARHLIVTDRPAEDRSALFLLNIETGARTALTSPSDANFDVEPNLSSDGRLLLFNRIRAEYLSDIFAQELDSAYRPVGAPRKLPAAANWNGTPRLLEDRKEVLMCSGSVPRLSLWRVGLDGSSKPVSLGIIGDYAVQSAVHTPTRRIVFRTYRMQVDILRYPIGQTRAATPEAPPLEPFLESTFIERSSAYSPDGSRVAFISDRTGRRQLWVSDGQGQKPVEWTQKFEADLPTPAWSADGSKIVFVGEGPAGFSQLFVAEGAGRGAIPISNDSLDYARAVWSHDGKFLYAAASDKSVFSIYRLPASGGAAEKILPGYRYVAGVEPNGKGLYVTRTERRNDSELDYVPLPSGEPVHVATVNFAEDVWVTREGTYYLDRRANRPLAPVALFFRSHSGAVRLLHEYTKPPGRGLSISADGKFAITTRIIPPISDLMLLKTSR